MNARKLGSYAVRAAFFACGWALVMSAGAGSAFADAPIPAAAPEVDPGSLTSVMTLLVGGALSLAGRVRKGR